MPIGSVTFPDGRSVPALGQGTWRMGEAASKRRQEIDALRAGLERGLTVIDTAEMYGEGATETLLGEALSGLRDRVYLVSKVYPRNAAGPALARACEGSLRRLRTERIDLYLLHWRGQFSLAETIDGMERLRSKGMIGAWGVSNFDVDDMEELSNESDVCATNQVLYNLTRRGPDFDLCGWMTKRSIPLMAYSPVEQGRLASHPVLTSVGQRHGLSAIQVALAWVLRKPGILAIPKAGTVAHVEANAAAALVTLTDEDLRDLDAAFPAPNRKRPLEML